MSLAQSSNIPPNANEYGGDEISAIVLDTGFTTVRAGFAGEDTPKSIVPTYYGVLSGRTLIGESKVNNPIPGLEIRHPFEKGDVSGTEKLNAIKDYAISSRLIPRKSRTIRDGGSKTNGGDKDVEMRDAADEQAKEEQEGGGLLRDTPLLSTEQDNVDEKSREAAIKHAFEVWDAPAYYAVRKSMVSTFSYGKHSAMVVDVGHRGVTVSPVWDGVLLTKSIRTSPLGGIFLNDQIRALFSKRDPPISLIPHYLVSSKQRVDANQPSSYTPRNFPDPPGPPAQSFRTFQEDTTILHPFKECIVQIYPQRLKDTQPGGATNAEIAATREPRPWEMPDGWNTTFGLERFKPGEALFDTTASLTDTAAPPSEQTIPMLVKSALDSCDVDLKPVLMSNILVVGGTSLTQGFNERLEKECMKFWPQRCKVLSPGNVVERKYASWIGGSILASLGSFHQLWVSRQEFEEFGPGIVHRRCK